MWIRNSISKHYLLEIYGSDGLYDYRNVEYDMDSTAMFEFIQVLLFQYTTVRYNRVKEGRLMSYLVMSGTKWWGFILHLMRYAGKVSLVVSGEDTESFQQHES